MIVTETSAGPCGTATDMQVALCLVGAGGVPTFGTDIANGNRVGGCANVAVSAGHWSCDLVPNSQIAPAGTRWRVERRIGCEVSFSYLNVPPSGGPWPAVLIEDDPLNEIENSALTSHALRPDLHGGGIRGQLARITSDFDADGPDANNYAVVPGLIVTVPDLARPVHLHAFLGVGVTPGGPATADVQTGLFPYSGVGTTVGGFVALDGSFVEGTDNDATPTRTVLFAPLEPHSPGQYCVAANTVTSPFSARIFGSALVKSHLYWITV